MAEQSDSNGEPAAPSASDGGPDAALPSDSLSDVVPRSELDSERKRRAGQERAHQRELAKVRTELAELKKLTTEALQGRSAGDAQIALPKDVLDSLDQNDPRDRVLLDLYRNQSAWSQHMRSQEEERQRQVQLSTAVEDAVDEVLETGIPRSVLDLSSPQAVRASAEKWQLTERIRKTEEELATLRGNRQTSQEAAQAAVTRERVRLGATQVPTSIGTAPPLPTAVQEQLTQYDQQITQAKRSRQGSEVIRLSRERQVLLQEAESAAP